MRFVIVTGVSGAGKTAVLENAGGCHTISVWIIFPFRLLEKFAITDAGGTWRRMYRMRRLVLMQEAVTPWKNWNMVLDKMKEAGYDFEILFMDAEDSVLVKAI